MTSPSPDWHNPLYDSPTTGVAAWTFAAARALIEGVVDGIAIIDGSGTIRLHNQAAAALFGVPAGELIGEQPLSENWSFVGPDGLPLSCESNPLSAARTSDQPVIRHSVGVSRNGGSNRWVHLGVRPLGLVPGLGQAMALVFERAPDPRSVTSLQALGQSLAGMAGGDLDGDRVLDRLFDQRSVGMVHSDVEGVVLRANEAFAAMLGCPVSALLGQRFDSLIDPDDLERDRLSVGRLVSGGAESYDAELRLRRTDGSTVETQIGTTAVRDADGRCQAIVSLVVDVSRLRRAEHFVSRGGLFDPLTQLINRTLLIDLLGDQLRVLQHSLAVISLNLDRFKAVNDSLGQAIGDGVLVEVARRLRGILRPGDAAARVGGDDFVLLCGHVGSHAQADGLTLRILDAIAEPIEVDGLRIQLSASAGVSLISVGAGLSADEVMYQATAALSHAKERGRARWKIFDAEMQTVSTDRLRIETSLRAALTDRRLAVAYQPLLDLGSDRVVGAEALVRWHDPVLGTVEPTTFLPVAEETGLIARLGAFVLGDATAQVAQWRDQTGQPLHVSVNLSPNELNRLGITERVAASLDAAGLPSTALRLEITENVLIDADEQVRHNLADLQALGVAVGIDDFGTGYASMSYLKSLPIDFVKIDRSFVAGLATSREDRAIVKATIDLAKALHLTTVAEGIETATQLDVLRELGCDIGQGFLIGHPAPAAEMLANDRT